MRTDNMRQLRDRIRQLEFETAYPQDMWKLGVLLCRMARSRANASDRDRSRGEEAADALSADATRTPQLLERGRE